MKVASRPINAVIFDMDGVLLDSEPLHHQATNAVLVANDCASLSFSEFAAYLGADDEFIWDDLACRHHLARPVSCYRDEFAQAITELYRTHASIADGALELLGSLQQLGLPIALASSSRREWVETCLDSIAARRFFQEIIDGEMVTCAKPDPSIYLLAADKLDIAADECLAVEDSRRGITAAVSAGMLTVAVDTPYTHHHGAGGAHLQVDSLIELAHRLTAFERKATP